MKECYVAMDLPVISQEPVKKDESSYGNWVGNGVSLNARIEGEVECLRKNCPLVILKAQKRKISISKNGASPLTNLHEQYADEAEFVFMDMMEECQTQMGLPLGKSLIK